MQCKHPGKAPDVSLSLSRVITGHDDFFFYDLFIDLSGPPAPMNRDKLCKGCPPPDAPSKLVQPLYKTFPPDQRDLVEMQGRSSYKTSIA